MTRAAFAFRCTIGLALMVWWAPTILLLVGRLAGEAARFGAVMLASRALGAVGLRRAALRMLDAERDRCAAKLAVIRARRGW